MRWRLPNSDQLSKSSGRDSRTINETPLVSHRHPAALQIERPDHGQCLFDTRRNRIMRNHFRAAPFNFCRRQSRYMPRYVLRQCKSPYLRLPNTVGRRSALRETGANVRHIKASSASHCIIYFQMVSGVFKRKSSLHWMNSTRNGKELVPKIQFEIFECHKIYEDLKMATRRAFNSKSFKKHFV